MQFLKSLQVAVKCFVEAARWSKLRNKSRSLSTAARLQKLQRAISVRLSSALAHSSKSLVLFRVQAMRATQLERVASCRVIHSCYIRGIRIYLRRRWTMQVLDCPLVLKCRITDWARLWSARKTEFLCSCSNQWVASRKWSRVRPIVGSFSLLKMANWCRCPMAGSARSRQWKPCR